MDPERSPETPLTIEAGTYPCRQCGAFLAWDATANALACEHCGYAHDLREDPAPPVEELDLQAAIQEAARGLGLPVETLRCKRCGAGITFPAGKASSACPYCGSVRVRTEQANVHHLQPNGIVPFTVPRDSALESFRLWKRDAPGLPRKLREVSPFLIEGLYVPFWTFDARAFTKYAAFVAEEHESVDTFQVQQEDRVVKRTKLRTFVENKPVSGDVEHFYDDLLILASEHPPRGILREARAFDLTAVRPYRPEYLAGFQSVEYAHPLERAWIHAHAQLIEHQKQQVEKQYEGQILHHLKTETRFEGLTFKHLLLPYWHLAYRFAGKTYHVVVNGQTGQIAAQTPRLRLQTAGIVIAVVLLIFLMTYCVAT